MATSVNTVQGEQQAAGVHHKIEGNFPLDTAIIAVLPAGFKVISADSYGSSAWSVTARVAGENIDGSRAQFFLKYATEDSGKAQLEGEFKAMSELFKTMPTLVPRPFAWGKLQLQSPPTYFFLCEFVNISDSLPDPVKLGKCLAELHKESITDWESSWTLFFGRLLAGIYQLDIDTNGTWGELDDMMDQTLRHVIPRLLGALESNGRTVKPCLIHGDLWEGNIGTDFETGNLYIFDSCAYYAHNEMEIGMWRVDHHRLKAKAYRQEYIRNVEPSEPAEEWDDRNRLYSVKTKLMYSAHVPGSKVRKQAFEDLSYLVRKYECQADDGSDGMDITP